MTKNKTTAEWIDYYRSDGYSTGKIASILSLPPEAVESYVLRSRVDMGSNDHWESSNITQAIQMRKAGKTIREISNKLGVPTGTLSVWMSQNNVIRKSKDGNREPVDVKEIE